MIASEMINILKKQDRAYWLVVAMKMLHGFGWFLIFPIMPLVARRLGAGPFIVGLLMATPAVFQMSIPLIGGTIISQMGKKKMFVLAFLLGILSALVYIASPGYMWLFFGQFLLGVSHAFFEPCFTSYVTDLADSGETSRLLGFVMGLHAINAMIGPAVAGTLIDNLSPVAVFILYLVIMLLGTALSYTLPPTATAVKGKLQLSHLFKSSTQDNRKVLLVAGVRFALFSSWTMFVSWAVFDSFFPLYSEDLGHSTQLLGLFLMMRGLASGIVRFASGFLVEKFGLRNLIYGSLLTSSLSFALLPYISLPIPIFATTLISGIAPGVLPVAATALIAEELSPKNRPVGMSLNQTCVGLGRLAGSSGFGYIAEQRGPQPTFIWASVAIAACTGILGIMNSMKKENKEVKEPDRR